jgi:hypothetical protein
MVEPVDLTAAEIRLMGGAALSTACRHFGLDF